MDTTGMTRPALSKMTRQAAGARFSLIEHDAFDLRRSDVLCAYCAKEVGMHTDLTMTASGRWAHTECHRVLS